MNGLALATPPKMPPNCPTYSKKLRRFAGVTERSERGEPEAERRDGEALSEVEGLQPKS